MWGELVQLSGTMFEDDRDPYIAYARLRKAWLEDAARSEREVREKVERDRQRAASKSGVVYIVTIYGDFEDAWGNPNYNAMASALWRLAQSGYRFSLQADEEQRRAYYGTWDGQPDEHVAHDNFDFRRINVGIPIWGNIGVSISYSWDKYRRHYFSIGPSISLFPISASYQTGDTVLNGQKVQDKASVERVLTGPNFGLEGCLFICFNGAYNVRSFDIIPRPVGGNTYSGGVGIPNVGVTKDWTWKLPF